MSKAQNVWRWWLGWRCVAYLAHAFVWGAACTFASLLLSLFYVPMLDGPGSTVDLLIGLSWRSLSMGGVNLVAAFVLYLVWPTIEWMVRPKNRDLFRGRSFVGGGLCAALLPFPIMMAVYVMATR